METGILYPHKSLVGRTGKYNLVVEARDGAGNGEQYDRADVTIQVLNVNDNAPKFIKPAEPNSTVEILEVGFSFFSTIFKSSPLLFIYLYLCNNSRIFEVINIQSKTKTGHLVFLFQLIFRWYVLL